MHNALESIAPERPNVSKLVRPKDRRTERKPEGISRELYGLLGAQAAPLLVQHKFKQRPKIRTKAKPWVLAEFSPVERNDLRFRHWLLKSDAEAGDINRFQKYCIEANVPTYTDEEYEQWLQDDFWSKQETDTLFALCREYNCNFYVIADRFPEYVADATDNSRMQVDDDRVSVGFDGTEVGEAKDKLSYTEATTSREAEKGTKQEDSQSIISDKDAASQKDSTRTESPVKTEANEQEYSQTSASEEKAESNADSITPSQLYGSAAPMRSVDDLKDRFYTVSRKLLLVRNPSGLNAAQEDLVQKMTFDKEKETRRKRMLATLSQRTPEQIREEENLIIEARRIEAQQKQLLQERHELLQVFDEIGSREIDGRNVDIAFYTSSQGLASLASGILHADKVKKKRESVHTGNNPQAASGTPSAHTSTKIKRVSPAEEHIYGISWAPKSHSAAFVRSQRIPSVKHSMASKVEAAMTELGIPSRLFMPTERTCRKYETLQNTVLAMLQLKSSADKLSAEQKIRTDAQKQ